MALVAPDCRLLAVDGRRMEGHAGVREFFTEFAAIVRSTTHTITAQWHVDNVWIAEVEAGYELRDDTRIGTLPRAVVLRDGPAGYVELHFYGAHERPLSEHRTGGEGLRIDGRWIPPL